MAASMLGCGSAVTTGDWRKLTARSGSVAHEIPATPGKSDVDPIVKGMTDGHLVVHGSDADLAAVVLRLLRTERLDVPVGYVPVDPGSRVARLWRLPADPVTAALDGQDEAVAAGPRRRRRRARRPRRAVPGARHDVLRRPDPAARRGRAGRGHPAPRARPAGAGRPERLAAQQGRGVHGPRGRSSAASRSHPCTTGSRIRGRSTGGPGTGTPRTSASCAEPRRAASCPCGQRFVTD